MASSPILSFQVLHGWCRALQAPQKTALWQIILSALGVRLQDFERHGTIFGGDANGVSLFVLAA